jgi:hypothetical protein
MLLTETANFRLSCPTYWSTEKFDEEGHPKANWMSVVFEALTLNPEESIAMSKAHLAKWTINADAYQQTVRDVAVKHVVKDASLVVRHVDGSEIDLNDIPEISLHVYAKIGNNLTHIKVIKWDHSEFAKNMIENSRRLLFSPTRIGAQIQ